MIQNRSSKEVKHALVEGHVRVQRQKNAKKKRKEKKSEPLRKLYCNCFHDSLVSLVWCLDGQVSDLVLVNLWNRGLRIR